MERRYPGSFGRIQAIVEKRNTMPILANVHLEAKSGKDATLELAATDLEVGILFTHVRWFSTDANRCSR